VGSRDTQKRVTDFGSEDATLSQRLGDGQSEPTLAVADGPAKEAPPLQPRTTLERYVILEVLGRGGMGVVYSAYDPELDRRIAIKVLGRKSNDRGNARMLREARAMARLSHPNVVKVHDVGTVEGSVFIAMESVDGETFEGLRVSHSCSVREVVDAYIEAAKGLAAAHEVGLIHRDFKPANVMRTHDGRVVVLDFGLAQPTVLGTIPNEHEDYPASLTATGAVMGTPAYMSPEQYAGDRVEAFTDQFSLCVSLYEALFGQRPFEDMLRAARRPRPQGVEVPGAVERVLDTGLRLDPKKRYPSMSALIDELETRPAEHRRRRWPTIVLVGLATAGSVGLLLPSQSSEECAGPFSRLEEAYGTQRRNAVVAAFGALSVEGAEAAGERIVSQLDHYASEWTAARTAACEAENEADESAEMHVQRLMCLDERLFALESVATAVTEVEANEINDAILSVADLPAIGQCGDRRFLLAEVRPPADADLAEQVGDIRRELAGMAYRINFTPLPMQVEGLVERARALEYDPLLTEVLSTASDMVVTHDRKKGRSLARQALLAAERSRYDRGILISRLSLAKLEHQEGHRDIALEHLRLAEVVHERMGSPEHLEVELLEARGRFAALDYRPDDARTHLLRAMELRKADGTYDTMLAVAAGAFLAEACLKLDDYACAREQMDHSLQVTKRQLGEQHPFRGQLLVLAADVAVAEGDADRSLELYDRATVIFEGMDESEFNQAVLANNRSSALMLKGDFGAAEASFKGAITITEAAYDSQHPMITMFQSNLAELLVRAGRQDEACRTVAEAMPRIRAHAGIRNAARRLEALHGDCRRRAGDTDGARTFYDRALALDQGEKTGKGVGYVLGLLGLAELELEQGNLDRAEQLASDVRPLCPANDIEGFAALATFTLARVRAKAGDVDSAIELARQAEKDLARFANWPHELALVRSWLAARGSK